jgi:hypothetical protein
MSYQLIDFHVIEDRLFLTAVVDDAALTRSQTLYDPPEHGPGLCEGVLYLDDSNDPILETIEEVQSYLDSTNREPDWMLITNS